MTFDLLFKPITINGLTIPNRINMPAMAMSYTHDFSFNDKLKDFYRPRAKGGVGLMTIGPVAIAPNAVYANMPGLFTEEHTTVLKEFIKELKQDSDVKLATQLMHMGRNAILFNGEQSLAPSAISGKMNRQVPRAMTQEDIETVKEQFSRSATMAKAAGFDLVEIVACTGYLISQFLSPLSNQREDEYGGSPENRMRFGIEVIQSVRKAVGEDFPISIRIAGNDFLPGGNTNQIAAQFAAAAEKAGADVINVTGGWHETYIPQLTTNVPPGAFLYLAQGVKNAVSIPVMASNRLGNPEVAEKALRSGACDMVCWGRPLIADPELPNKTRNNLLGEADYCIACNQGCFDAVSSGQPVHCVLNPLVGREGEVSMAAAKTPRTIMVAGGGPAGMKFAITAAKLGHRVSLYEKEAYLGGQVTLAMAPPGKSELGNITHQMEQQLSAASVSVDLNTELDVETVTEANPDLLVIATGAKPLQIKIEGIDKPHVVQAGDVLNGSVWDIGREVVIVGGSATGCETAHLVATMNQPDSQVISFLNYHEAESSQQIQQLLHQSVRNITIIDMVDRLAANVGSTSRWSLMKSLKLSGIQMKPKTRLKEITDHSVVVETESGVEEIKADTVIIAVGTVSDNQLAKQLEDTSVSTIAIGDAQSPRRITEAIKEGFDTALAIT